eukprot:gene11984-biopygen3283
MSRGGWSRPELSWNRSYRSPIFMLTLFFLFYLNADPALSTGSAASIPARFRSRPRDMSSSETGDRGMLVSLTYRLLTAAR